MDSIESLPIDIVSPIVLITTGRSHEITLYTGLDPGAQRVQCHTSDQHRDGDL